jgi:hypothetical protein
MGYSYNLIVGIYVHILSASVLRNNNHGEYSAHCVKMSLKIDKL